MVFMLMSGIFTPIASMPRWAEIITYANPLRYFADAMRSIYLKGGTLIDNWSNLACLAGLGTLTTLSAIMSYKKPIDVRISKHFQEILCKFAVRKTENQ